jgi:hypothetical protein
LSDQISLDEADSMVVKGGFKLCRKIEVYIKHKFCKIITMKITADGTVTYTTVAFRKCVLSDDVGKIRRES